MPEVSKLLKLFDRRKKSSETDIPPAVGELSSQYREIESENSFEENQEATIDIHKEELPDFIQNPTVAIVKRAYRELKNGNLTSQLDSLADLQTASDQVECIIVVNNPRIMAILANSFLQMPIPNGAEAANLLRRYFHQRKLEPSEYEEEFLAELESGKKNIQNTISAYAENQATLAVLNTVRDAVLNVINGSLYEQAAMEQLTEVIPHLIESFLDQDQTTLLVKAAQKLIKKKMVILGIDCSSELKSFQKVDLGQATNQGCHIAFHRGAQYLDISDMDEFNTPSSLNEVIQLSRTKKPDVLYRPLHVVNPQHPEQLKDASWNKLVYYYQSSALERNHEWQYAYYKPEEDHEAVHNTGHIITSRNAFQRHQYPHDDWMEDLMFSRRMQTDSSLSQYQLLDSELLLADRGRAESYDGSRYNRDITPEDVHHRIEINSLDQIEDLVASDKKIHDLLASEPSFHHYLRLYETAKAKYVRLGNKERRALRYIFLSPEGLLQKVFDILRSDHDISVEDFDELSLTPAQKVFLKNNPALLPALQKEIRKQDFTGIDEVKSFVEHSLPELFHSPISLEEVQSASLHNVNLAEELSQRGLININLWTHLYRSKQWLASYLTNEYMSGKIPDELHDKVDNLLRLLTK